MFERFTDGGRRSVVLAGEVARDLGHGSISVVHLFLGATMVLAETGDDVLEAHGVPPDRLRRSVADLLPAEQVDRPRDRHIPFTAGAKKTLELSLREALERGDNEIVPRHLLLAAIDNPDDGLGAVLAAVGLSAETVRADVERGMPPAAPRSSFLPGTRHRLDRIEALLSDIQTRLERIEQRLDRS